MSNTSVQNTDSKLKELQTQLLNLQSRVKASDTVSDGQFSEIHQAVLRGTTPFISRLRQVGGTQRFTAGTVVADAVCAALMALLPKRVKISAEDAEWSQKYYQDNYAISADFSELEVPSPVEYPTRLIVMHEAISNRCNPIAAVYKKHCAEKGFGWWQFTNDLDGEVKSHDRNGTYAIRVRDVVESEFGEVDGENLSTRQVLNRGTVTTTLPERLVDGDVYLLRTERQLDHQKVNLCPGTKLASGGIPGVGLDPDGRGVCVSFWRPGDADDYLRFRPAIG